MTKKEAILLMEQGVKVHHEYFSKDEWMTYEGNRVIFENGYGLWITDFWADRTSPGWLTGWSRHVELPNQS